MQETMNIHETDGGSVTVGLPDWDQTRRGLIALRVTHGADSAIGHRCSNAPRHRRMAMDRTQLEADETISSALHGTTREYYFAVYLNMMDWLVQEYRKDYAETAKLCDGKLDRSGRLLGRVRELVSRHPQ